MSAECDECGAFWEPDHDCPVKALRDRLKAAEALLGELQNNRDRGESVVSTWIKVRAFLEDTQ